MTHKMIKESTDQRLRERIRYLEGEIRGKVSEMEQLDEELCIRLTKFRPGDIIKHPTQRHPYAEVGDQFHVDALKLGADMKSAILICTPVPVDPQGPLPPQYPFSSNDKIEKVEAP